ncbi:MAG: SGNH/GDSL hydrolase family protein [Planctomycetota bacterium]|jgi:acyl-CoA thioesterase-1
MRKIILFLALMVSTIAAADVTKSDVDLARAAYLTVKKNTENVLLKDNADYKKLSEEKKKLLTEINIARNAALKKDATYQGLYTTYQSLAAKKDTSPDGKADLKAAYRELQSAKQGVYKNLPKADKDYAMVQKEYGKKAAQLNKILWAVLGNSKEYQDKVKHYRAIEEKYRLSKYSPKELSWHQSVSKAYRYQPAMAYVKDNPALPDILLIGDSISIGYTPTVRKVLAGKADVYRIFANGGPTAKGLENIDSWLKVGSGSFSVIHFNWGLHDCFRRVPLKDYEANLEKLILKLKATGAKLIWASSTPLPDGNPWISKGKEELKYNEAAARLAAKHKIKINDLHKYVTPVFDKHVVKPGDVHFTSAGSRYLGKKVATEIEEMLKY